MAENDIILVKEEARDIMRDLEKSVPTSTPTATVVGARSSAGAMEYRNAMASFMGDSIRQFRSLMNAIHKDCGNAIEAIDDLHRQDEEIMALLKKYDEEFEATKTSTSTTTSSGAPGTTWG